MFARLLAPTIEVHAHCDLPCGVYDPAQARIEAESIKAIIAKVADNDDPDFRTRAVLIKEQRSELVKHHLWVLWTDYFKPPHFEKYPQLHKLVNEATKLAGATGTKGSMDADGRRAAGEDRRDRRDLLGDQEGLNEAKPCLSAQGEGPRASAGPPLRLLLDRWPAEAVPDPVWARAQSTETPTPAHRPPRLAPPETGQLSKGDSVTTRSDVELRLPADSAYVAVLRTATAGLAARLDFTLDDIEDLRIAVDEACAMVLPQARADADLTARSTSARASSPSPSRRSATRRASRTRTASPGRCCPR